MPVPHLGFDLTEEQRMVGQMAADFARDRVAPFAAEWDATKTFPVDRIRELGELGMLGIKVPFEDGGAGGDLTSYVMAIEALAEGCSSMAVTVAVANLFADVVSQYGNAEQKAKYLAPYLEGQLGPGSFCLSEPGSGSDASGMTTTAVRDGDHFVLNGTKQWITNGGHAGLHVVFARTDPEAGSRGITAFLVEAGTPGLSVGPEEKKMGLRASNTVPLILEDCRVPAANILGEENRGYAVALANLDGGRIGISAQCIGIAEAAMREGLAYATERKCFGKPVTAFQNSQFAIADSRMELDQAWLLTLRAAHVKDKTGRSARESSMAKLFASEALGRIVDRMLQLHGGYGYVEEYAIERLYRDARVTRIYEGTSEVQRIVIGRDILA